MRLLFLAYERQDVVGKEAVQLCFGVVFGQAADSFSIARQFLLLFPCGRVSAR